MFVRPNNFVESVFIRKQGRLMTCRASNHVRINPRPADRAQHAGTLSDGAIEDDPAGVRIDRPDIRAPRPQIFRLPRSHITPKAASTNGWAAPSTLQPPRRATPDQPSGTDPQPPRRRLPVNLISKAAAAQRAESGGPALPDRAPLISKAKAAQRPKGAKAGGPALPDRAPLISKAASCRAAIGASGVGWAGFAGPGPLIRKAAAAQRSERAESGGPALPDRAPLISKAANCRAATEGSEGGWAGFAGPGPADQPSEASVFPSPKEPGQSGLRIQSCRPL